MLVKYLKLQGSFETSEVVLVFIRFLWKEEEWWYCIVTNMECKIKGDKGTVHVIKILTVEESRQIMGVWKNLMSNNTTQVDEIIEKYQAMINKIKLS